MPPLASGRVIHARWSEHHQPTAQGTMTATCRVVRPGIGTAWDPVTESTIPNPPTVVVASGPCRVQAFMQATTSPVAGQQVTQRRYRVSLPAAAPTADTECRILIETCPADTALAGSTLFIEDVVTASERFQRDYVANLNLG